MKDDRQRIIDACEEVFGVNLKKRCRKRESFIWGRRAYYYLARKMHPEYTLSYLAEPFGQNHATVIHALKRAIDELDRSDFRYLYNRVCERLGINGISEKVREEPLIDRNDVTLLSIPEEHRDHFIETRVKPYLKMLGI